MYPPEEIQSFFVLLTEKYLGWNRLKVSMKLDEAVSEEISDTFQEASRRLWQYEPIQYIIGEAEFYSLKFKVNSATLIPRPETEELVAWILDEKKSSWNGSILDIGTGSGCIAVSLAKHLEKANVHALDISEEALVVAKKKCSVK